LAQAWRGSTVGGRPRTPHDREAGPLEDKVDRRVWDAVGCRREEVVSAETSQQRRLTGSTTGLHGVGGDSREGVTANAEEVRCSPRRHAHRRRALRHPLRPRSGDAISQGILQHSRRGRPDGVAVFRPRIIALRQMLAPMARAAATRASPPLGSTAGRS
jgi:hypothetical protein